MESVAVDTVVAMKMVKYTILKYVNINSFNGSDAIRLRLIASLTSKELTEQDRIYVESFGNVIIL